MLWKYKRIYSENPIGDTISDEMTVISDTSSATSVGVCAYSLVNNVLVAKGGLVSGVIEVNDTLIETATYGSFDGLNEYWKIMWYSISYTIKVNNSGLILEVIPC